MRFSVKLKKAKGTAAFRFLRTAAVLIIFFYLFSFLFLFFYFLSSVQYLSVLSIQYLVYQYLIKAGFQCTDYQYAGFQCTDFRVTGFLRGVISLLHR